MRGCELIGRPTKPKFLLEQGELRALFEGATGQRWDPLRNRWNVAPAAAAASPPPDAPAGADSAVGCGVADTPDPEWEVVMDEVRPISDGRPLSFFMATRTR